MSHVFSSAGWAPAEGWVLLVAAVAQVLVGAPAVVVPCALAMVAVAVPLRDCWVSFVP